MALGVGVGDGFGVEVAVGSGVSEGVDPSCELFGVGEGSAGSSESLGLAGVSELSGEDGATGGVRVEVGVGSTTLFESGFGSVSPLPQLTIAIERVARARIQDDESRRS